IRALDLAMEADKQILLVAQKSAETDDPVAGDLYEVGTLAHVLQLLKLPDGTIKVLVEGVARARVEDVVEHEGTLSGSARVIEPVADREERELRGTAGLWRGRCEQYVKTNRKIPRELMQTLTSKVEPVRLANTIAAHHGVRLGAKQKL